MRFTWSRPGNTAVVGKDVARENEQYRIICMIGRPCIREMAVWSVTRDLDLYYRSISFDFSKALFTKDEHVF